MTRVCAAGCFAVALLLGGCEDQHGFLKISGNMLFADADRLQCGEASVAPQAGGFVDAFVALRPQDCTLMLRKEGAVLWFGVGLCPVHIDNNRITSVYLTESRGTISCSFGGA